MLDEQNWINIWFKLVITYMCKLVANLSNDLTNEALPDCVTIILLINSLTAWETKWLVDELIN